MQRLEITYNQIDKLEDIHWDIIMKEFSPEIRGVISYATLQVVKPDKLYSIEMLNIFIECIYLTKGKDVFYNQALAEINAVTDLINEELKQFKR